MKKEKFCSKCKKKIALTLPFNECYTCRTLQQWKEEKEKMTPAEKRANYIEFIKNLPPQYQRFF